MHGISCFIFTNIIPLLISLLEDATGWPMPELRIFVNSCVCECEALRGELTTSTIARSITAALLFIRGSQWEKLTSRLRTSGRAHLMIAADRVDRVCVLLQ